MAAKNVQVWISRELIEGGVELFFIVRVARIAQIEGNRASDGYAEFNARIDRSVCGSRPAAPRKTDHAEVFVRVMLCDVVEALRCRLQEVRYAASAAWRSREKTRVSICHTLFI